MQFLSSPFCFSAFKMVYEFFNANPVVYKKKERQVRGAPSDTDESAVEPIDHLEVFDILSK